MNFLQNFMKFPRNKIKNTKIFHETPGRNRETFNGIV